MMLIVFFLFACLLQGSFTVYRIIRERTEIGESDSGISKYLFPVIFGLALVLLAVAGGHLFDGIDKRTAAIGASFAGFLWLPRVAIEHYYLHMTHKKEEIFYAITYVICSIILIVRS